jgi:hypothetical protein
MTYVVCLWKDLQSFPCAEDVAIIEQTANEWSCSLLKLLSWYRHEPVDEIFTSFRKKKELRSRGDIICSLQCLNNSMKNPCASSAFQNTNEDYWCLPWLKHKTYTYPVGLCGIRGHKHLGNRYMFLSCLKWRTAVSMIWWNILDLYLVSREGCIKGSCGVWYEDKHEQCDGYRPEIESYDTEKTCASWKVVHEENMCICEGDGRKCNGMDKVLFLLGYVENCPIACYLYWRASFHSTSSLRRIIYQKKTSVAGSIIHHNQSSHCLSK